MATPADAVVTAAQSHVGEAKGDNDCARFVSDVFAATGHGSLFGYHARVPDIVAQFSGGAISSDVGSALPADLIVFGPNGNGEMNAHVMIYAGNGHVIGTAGKVDAQGDLIPGSTKVQNVTTDSMSPRANKVLRTALYNPTLTGPTVATWLGVPAGTPFTQDIANQAAAKYCHAQVPNGGQAYTYCYNDGLGRFGNWLGLGVTCGQVPFNVTANGFNTNQVTTPTPDQQATGDTTRGSVVPDLFGTLFGWVPSFALQAGILLLAAFLVYAGIREVTGSVD